MTAASWDLRRAAVDGIVSIGASQIARQALQIAFTAVLARYLAPGDFGLVGMAAVTLAFVGPLNELGMGAALIQKRDATPSHATSVFWCQVLASSTAALLLFLLAPWVAAFFQREEIAPLLQALCVGLPLGAAAAVPQALLSRQLRFSRVAAAETISLAVAGSIAVAAAASGLGVKALVAQSLAGSLVGAILMISLAGFNPFAKGAAPSLARVRELASFSAPLTGYQLFNYVSRNIDDVLIGRFLGADALGYYSMAYRVMMYPLQKVSGIVGRVAFPAFSALEEDLPRIRRAYIRSVEYVALVTFPMMAVIMATCPEFTRLLLGERWLPAIPLIAILSIAGMAGSIGTTTGPLYLARGRSDLMLRWEIGVAAVITTAIVAGLPGGLTGVAVAFTIASLVIWPVGHLIANRLIGQSTVAMFAALLPATALAGVMGIAMGGLRLLWEPATRTGQIAFIGACLAVAASVFVMAAALNRPGTVRAFITLGREALRRPVSESGGMR